MRAGSLLARTPLPSPKYVSLADPLPIVNWMTELLRAGQTPHLKTFASSAVRVCQAALEAGIDLRGAQFTLSGEPVTQARLTAIRQAGAEAAPRFGTSETGLVGNGCLAPQAPDDLHFFHDLNAVIQPGQPAQDLSTRSLLITSLRPSARLILLNVSLGDEAEVLQRACGCPMEHVGWTAHLHTIRSFEKLTASGMTFLDTDVIRVLEEVLPARFGGVPTDYQLVEEETEDGQPRLRLLVHPRLGSVAPEAMREAFLTAISPGSGVEKMMGLLWRQARLLEVERQPALATASGKILHLHLNRSGAKQ